jgi:hypothetical protein
MTLHGGKGSSAPPPDPRLIEAQIKSMGIQDSAIQQILANSAELAPLQKQQLQLGLDATKRGQEESAADRQYGLERRGQLSTQQDRMISDANNFDLPGRQEQMAGEAVGDVRQSFDAARGIANRGLERYGVNPGDARFAGSSMQMATQEALAGASAANKVRQAARLEGYSLTDRAGNALAGYPAQSMGATAAGVGYGSSGLGLANAGLAGVNSGYGQAGGAAGAMGANATGMFNAQANYKNTQDQIAASSDPFNTILGAATGIGSAWALGKVG